MSLSVESGNSKFLDVWYRNMICSVNSTGRAKWYKPPLCTGRTSLDNRVLGH